ncbi:MAG: hypothetical protein ACYCVH_05160 [Ignavibacteriaceae bacterium]
MLYLKRSIGLIIILSLLSICSCSTGVEPLPGHGTLRIILQSSPSDTSIKISDQTINVDTTDYFQVIILQGKSYNNNYYAILFKTTTSYLEQDEEYNLISKENDSYEKFTLFESYVPPQQYDSIQFGLLPEQLKMGDFNIAVQVQPNNSYLLNLPINFQVYENRVTQITVEIDPFESLMRFRDLYYFIPKAKIKDVSYF